MAPSPRPATAVPVWRVRDRASFAALRGQRRLRQGPLGLTKLAGDRTRRDSSRPDPPRVARAVGDPPRVARAVGDPPRVARAVGDPPRVAYAIGRRVGSAVARNRLRRRLRHVVREHASRLEPGATYLFSAEPAATTLSFEGLRDAVAGLIEASEGTPDVSAQPDASRWRAS